MQGILLVGGSIVLSSLGVWLVRRKFPVPALQPHHEVGGILIAVVGTIYAVLLGFMVVVIWQSFDDASKNDFTTLPKRADFSTSV